MGWTGAVWFYKNWYGIVIVTYVAAFYFAMYYSSIDAYAYKFCANTPEGIWTGDSAGQDPIYGIEAKRCDREQIMELRNGKGKLPSPHEIQVADVSRQVWFN